MESGIDFICANYANRKDGIGHYAYNVVDSLRNHIKVRVISGEIKDNKLRRLFSLTMTKCMLKTLFNRKITIIEYPFAEYNPIVVFMFLLLSIVKRRKVVVSLHEFFRVNFLRKFVIRMMIRQFDVFLITDEKTKSYLESKSKTVYKRSIPSNITCLEKGENPKRKERYVYFGLINHSKAIEETIAAWKLFNVDKNCELHIISSSNTSWIPKEGDIKVISNAPDKLVDSELQQAGFILLPIRPEVNVNNASYFAGIARRCIPIGMFNENLDTESYIVLKDYSVLGILEGLKESKNLSCKEYIRRQKRIEEIAVTLPSFTNVAATYLKCISTL